MIKKILLVLVVIILTLIIVSIIISMYSYVHLVTRSESYRKQHAEEMQKKIEKAEGHELSPEAGLDISINKAVQLQDIILIEAELTNKLKVNQYYNSYYTKLKDKEMMQCAQIRTPGEVNFPFKEIERKGFFAGQDSAIFPNETLKGYLCFRCPNQKTEEYTLLLNDKKVDFTPAKIFPGSNIEVTVNDSVQYYNSLYLDISLTNKSTDGDYYSSELFTLKDQKGALCKREDSVSPGSITPDDPIMNGLRSGNLVGVKFTELSAGKTVRGYLCFNHGADKGGDLTLIASPSSREIKVSIARVIEPPVSAEEWSRRWGQSGGELSL